MKTLTKNIITRRLNQKLDVLLARYNPTIIVVTGSVGKTTTKIAIGTILSEKYKVCYSIDSYNFDISLPLSVFNLKVPPKLWDMLAWRKIFQRIDDLIENYPYEIVVLEVAEDEREKMEPVVARLRPKIAVITEVSAVHMARMENVETVLRDSWAIASHAQKIYYNADSSLLRHKAGKNSSAIGFGFENGTIRANNISRSKKGELSVTLTLSSMQINVQTHLVARHILYSWLVGCQIGLELGLTKSQIKKSLLSAKAQAGRMNALAGVNQSLILDDSYNASPKAVEAALDTLAEIGQTGRKIAVLGSMNELGEASAKAHEEIGQKAATSIDLLLTVGKVAGDFLATAAGDAGLGGDKIKIFRTPYEAGHFLKKILKPGDVVLVKGSQDGVYTEETTRILLDKELDPNACLVRQSQSWRRKKKRAFAL